jgi:hypothetical protein
VPITTPDPFGKDFPREHPQLLVLDAVRRRPVHVHLDEESGDVERAEDHAPLLVGERDDGHAEVRA